MKQAYTLGFLFSFDKQKVALIRKERPNWQKGKFNGIGGHTEQGETAEECIEREFGEEVEYPSPYKTEWKKFALIDNPKYTVDCFTALGDLTRVRGKTDEPIEVVNVDQIHPLRNKDMIDNLPFLVAMAIDFIEDGRPSFATIQYE